MRVTIFQVVNDLHLVRLRFESLGDLPVLISGNHLILLLPSISIYNKGGVSGPGSTSSPLPLIVSSGPDFFAPFLQGSVILVWTKKTTLVSGRPSVHLAE